METAEDIHIFTIPCYHKRQIRFRPEVADMRDDANIYRQNFDGVWEVERYHNGFLATNCKQYDTEAEAIKAAQDFVEQLKTQ